MIVIDSSALVAILDSEPEAPRFLDAIAGCAMSLLSAANLVECAIVIESRYGEKGKHELDHFISRAGIEIAAVDAAQAELARQAFRRYGKGRDRAGLNFGDCFAWALARATGYPLLYKGGDFSHTDVESALEK